MTLDQLEQADINLFWWINQHHCLVSDWVLWFFSQAWAWVIVLTTAYYFTCIRKERHNWWVVFLAIGLCFLLSDRVSVLCFKNVFCRLRPCHALEGVRMFYTHCGGQYGFVSSHASNAFCVAMFLTLRWHNKLREGAYATHGPWRWLFPLLMFLWAAVMCYSRPYLGKHYPGDVICGTLVGLPLGVLTFFIVQAIENRVINPIREKKFQK